MKLIDSHAHYDDTRFREEFEGGRDAALRLSFDAGVEAVINVATKRNNILTASQEIALFEYYNRKEAGEPVQYIVGECEFSVLASAGKRMVVVVVLFVSLCGMSCMSHYCSYIIRMVEGYTIC